MWKLLFCFVVCSLIFTANAYNWQLLQKSGTPSPRFDFAYGYGEYSKEFYIFGGQSSSGIVGDFFSFNSDLNKWATLPNGPSARRDAASTYCNDVFYVLGGRNSTSTFDDMWAFSEDSNEWSLIGQFPDLQLSGGSLTCFDTSNQLLHFGGVSANGYYSNETYVFNITSNTWTVPVNSSGPSGRIDSPIGQGYAPFERAKVIFGGYNTALPNLNDCWVLTGTQWTQVEHKNVWPPGRSGHVIAYDWLTSGFIMFGGEDDSGNALNDLWLFSLNSNGWTQLQADGAPGGRLGAGIATTEYSGTLLFGGVSGFGPSDSSLNEVWVLKESYDPTSAAARSIFILWPLLLFYVVCVL